MSNQASPEVSSNDKILVALGYPIVLISIILLFMEDKKSQPFIKFHAVQSIAANVAFYILAFVLSLFTLGFGGLCVPVIWLLFWYWAYRAYKGERFEIPVVTNFIRKQGWV
jgi:uncharacterized membrane protein